MNDDRTCPICGGPMDETDVDVCSHVCAGRKSFEARLAKAHRLTLVEWALIGGLVAIVVGAFAFIYG